MRRGGGGLFIYCLVKLYDFLPAQRNVCKTTMYFNNFNTTLNVVALKCSTIYFSTIQLIYKYVLRMMFMTSMKHHVIFPKMKTN